MDAQQFVAEFRHIANAPGGVLRLRELMLSLAFKGELCENSPSPVDNLLRSIELQRTQWNVETRKQRLVRQSFEANNGPYSIPENWRWASLSTLGHTWGQKKPDAPFVYIDVSSIDNKAGVLSGSLDVLNPDSAPSRARKIVKKGTLIYSTVRPYLLNIAVIDRNFDYEPIASTAFAVVHPWEGIEQRFLYYYLRSPLFIRYVESVQIGMAYPAISDEKFYSGLVPLPPTEEQSRIVAKVDELMALCDKLEVQQQERRKVQNALRQSTLQAVANTQSPHELRSTWGRLETNFGELFRIPEDLAQLRSLCVELAIRGELVPSQSETTDESVEGFIRQLSSQKIGKRAAKIPRMEAPFAVPEGWQWVLFDDLLVDSDSGWSPKCDAEPRRPGEWGVLKVSAVTWGEFRPEENKRLPPSLEPRVECEVRPGDFLLSRANTAELVARSVIAAGNVPQKLLMSDKIVRLNFIDSEVKAWANLVNNSLYAREYYRQNATGTSDSMRNVARQVIHELPLPLPPKPVQVAIMRKLGQLGQYCNRLEDQLREAREKAGKLAVTAVSSLTGIAIEHEEEEPVKIPQTELIAPLRMGQTPDVKAQAPLATLLVRHNGEMSASDLWQRFGGEIDAFYDQLKTEVAHGWIQEPAVAEMHEKVVDTAGA